jgi:RluA family pseudouridine synthase
MQRRQEKPRKRPESRGRNRPQEKGAIWHPGPTARSVGTEAGLDLAHFIALQHRTLSVRAIRRHLDTGSCRVNGQVERFGSRILKRHDVVEFYVPESRPQDHDFESKRLLRETDAFIAYDKPAGLPVTPDDAGKKWNLLSLLSAKFGHLIPVHRLDADTSGIVIMARNEKTARALEDSFRSHSVQKTYLAIVRGHPRETGLYRSYLVKKASQKGSEKWGSGKGQDAREAETHWTVEERLGKYGSLVRVEPKTGRYHQIRIHFSEMGHPIYGDRIYGDRADPIHVTRHLLHAWQAIIPDPSSKDETMEIKTPMPKEFVDAMAALKKL